MRMISLVLSILLIFVSMPSIALETSTIGYLLPDSAAAEEYTRAIEYGFVPDELTKADPDETIVTWQQYCRMIYAWLALENPQAAVLWEEEAALALNSSESLLRSQGCFLLFRASDIAGINMNTDHQIGRCDPNLLPVIRAGEDYSWYFLPFTGEGNDGWIFEVTDTVMGRHEPYYAAFLYCYSKVSLVTGAPLYNTQIRLNQPLTLRAAALSVVRSYESNVDRAAAFMRNMDERFKAEVANYEEPAEVTAKRQSILESETTIIKGEEYIPGKTYTGNAYYVSMSGNDQNNGLSPEKAWKTLGRVSDADLKYGDAVFFERGGIWRGMLSVLSVEGITISAYGEGSKPILTASPENGASEEKWELVYEGENGKKVWKFYQDMLDCGVIALDDSIAACKICPVWTGNEWLTKDGAHFDVGTGLPENFDFFSDISAMLEGTTEFNDYTEIYGIDFGPLYLRCDEGNPGTIFGSIEFASVIPDWDSDLYEATVLKLAPYSVLDNFSIKYYPMSASFNIQNGVVQNCEFAWGGGCIQGISNGYVGGRMGDALSSAWTKNYTVQNNYFHDLFASCMIIEGAIENGDGGPVSNVSFIDNLAVNTGGLNFRQDRGCFENLLISGNLFYQNKHDWSFEHAIRGGQFVTEYMKFIRFQNDGTDATVPEYRNCSISNNTFYYNEQYFIVAGIDQSNMPSFENNTYYCTNTGLGFAWWVVIPNGGGHEPVYYENAETFFHEYMNDTTSIILSADNDGMLNLEQ